MISAFYRGYVFGAGNRAVEANDQNRIMATSATPSLTSERPHQQSSLLALPAEIRIMIYDLALQDTLNEFDAQARIDEVQWRSDHSARSKFKPFPPFLGALTIPHTSYKLRTESIDTMKRLAQEKVEKLADASQAEHLTLSPGESTSQDIMACALYDSVLLDGRRLAEIFQKLATSQNPLRISRTELAWLKLSHSEKLSRIKDSYSKLTREQQISIRATIYTGVTTWIVWDVIARRVDLKVGQHDRKPSRFSSIEMDIQALEPVQKSMKIESCRFALPSEVLKATAREYCYDPRLSHG